MAINDILAAAAQKLGLADSEITTAEKQLAVVEQAIRTNSDQLSKLKLRIAALDEQLKRKKQEYEAAAGGMKKVIKEEMMILFAAQDRIVDEEISIISGRIKKDTLLRDRIKNMIFYIKNPANTDLIADIAADLEIVIDENTREELEMGKLGGIKFNPEVPSAAENSRFDEFISGSNALADAMKKQEEDDEFEKRFAEIQ